MSAETTFASLCEALGREMREWVCLPVAEADRWRAYAEEALAFARR